MSNNITNVMNGSQVTMSSREIAELTNKQHKNVLRDIRDMIDTLIKDGSTMSHEINQQVMIEYDNRGYAVEALLTKKYVECLLTGYSIPLRMKVIERMHELEQVLVSTVKPQKRNDDGLVEYRKAKALDMYTKAMDRVFNQLPSLSEVSKQAVYATTINPLVGHEVLPLPILEEKTHSATDIGKMFGVSANKIGRVAKELGIKTDEYTIIVLDKSRHSDKQVESIRYKNSAVPLFTSYFAALRSDTE